MPPDYSDQRQYSQSLRSFKDLRIFTYVLLSEDHRSNSCHLYLKYLGISLQLGAERHQVTVAFIAADGGGHQIARMSKAIELDERVTVRLPGSLRRRLEDAAKRDRRRVTEFARIVWQDWLAAHASDT
jgi:hypothetical protein